jgi:DNA primase
MDLLELAIEKGLEPNKTSNKDGGEFHSGCPNPNCDADEDGFILWPNSPADKCTGRFWCRKCDVKGDTLQFCMDFLGMTWREACVALNVEIDDFHSSVRTIAKRPEKTPKVTKTPTPLWQEKASNFVDWCHEQLLRTPHAIDQIKKRGFTTETIKCFKLGYCPKKFKRPCSEWGLEEEGELSLHRGFIIPWIATSGKVIKIKVRSDTYENDIKEYEKRSERGENLTWKPNKYLHVKGGMTCQVVYGDQSLKVGILTEAEFDGLLIQQEASDHVFSIANGGSKQPIDLTTDHLIRTTPLILLCPDDDDGGDFLQNLLETYPNMKLWPAPIGKSPGDALKYHRVDLRSWIIQGIYSDN